MATYFPRRQQSFACIKKKFLTDLTGARVNAAVGFAFVTNQALTEGERGKLIAVAAPTAVEIYHLERIVALLDSPPLAAIRKQFLGIDYLDSDSANGIAELRAMMMTAQKRLEAIQSGGDTFCYFMLYDFDLAASCARNLAIIREGDFPLYDVRLRVRDMDASHDVFERSWGAINAPADYLILKWQLPPSVYYRIFFHARNGNWNQDLILRRSESARCWLAATRVMDRTGRNVIFTHIDNGCDEQFGAPHWQQ